MKQSKSYLHEVALQVGETMLSLSGFRYCPHCGQESLYASGIKAAHCDKCDYTFFHNSASAAAAIIEKDGNLILVRRSRDPQAGMLDLPGGFVDYAESAEQAVLREVREELGIAIQIRRYLGSYPNRYTYRGVTYFTTDSVFIAAPGGVVNRADLVGVGDEIAEVIEVNAGELDLDQVAFVSMRQALEDYIKLYGR